MTSQLYGTTKSRFTRMNRPPEGTSWRWLTADMLESSAWRALSGNAIKAVMRICLEHLKHGGVENGKLPVTYNDFVKWGIRKNSIREALSIAQELGWIDRTRVGEVPWHGNIRAPSTFGLTWLPGYDGAPPSNRWKEIKDRADAKRVIRQACGMVRRVRQLPPYFNRQKKQVPTPEHATHQGTDGDTYSSSVLTTVNKKFSEPSGSDSDTPFYISGYGEPVGEGAPADKGEPNRRKQAGKSSKQGRHQPELNATAHEDKAAPNRRTKPDLKKLIADVINGEGGSASIEVIVGKLSRFRRVKIEAALQQMLLAGNVLELADQTYELGKSEKASLAVAPLTDQNPGLSRQAGDRIEPR